MKTLISCFNNCHQNTSMSLISFAAVVVQEIDYKLYKA